MVKALRSCLEAAKGKIKAGHLILRKSPKRTATGSSTASNISRICRIYSLLVPGILESRMSQETDSYWQSPSSREKLSQNFPLFVSNAPERAQGLKLSAMRSEASAGDPDECAATEALSSAGLPGMLSEFSGSPPSIRITEPAIPIPVTGWTPFLDHGFLGPFDLGPSKAFRHRCRSE